MVRNTFKSLGKFKVLTFDCYGTLIDWETGIWDAFQPLIMRNTGSELTRDKVLEAFADTADALRFLKTRFKLVILSNVNREGFSASRRKLGVDFDAVYTAEDIGTYKPDPGNFQYLLTRLREDHGLEKADILHTAQSLFHDHIPAQKFGLATAWINRQRLSETGKWGATARLDEVPETEFLFHSMAEMAAAV